MTRDEAIKWVKFVHDVLYEDKDEDIRAALDMAIDALKREQQFMYNASQGTTRARYTATATACAHLIASLLLWV